MDWQLLASRLHGKFDRFTSKLIEGDGFTVRIYSRYGLRYCEGGKELTLMTGDEEATDRYGRTWLVFPTTETQIFVPNHLAWDDGRLFTEPERTRVINRIRDTFKRRKEPHRVVFGDEIYEQIWRDMQPISGDELGGESENVPGRST